MISFLSLYTYFTHFSVFSIARNRKPLLENGATIGLVNVVMGLKSWTIAKLCTVALSNLTMEKGGEHTMLKESFASALIILIGLEKHRLLPICMQSLYNTTCVEKVGAEFSMVYYGHMTLTTSCFLFVYLFIYPSTYRSFCTHLYI